MVQVKPADVDRLLRTPDPAIRFVLIYGGDEGLVTERMAAFVKAVAGTSDDPFSHVRMEPAALSDDPAYLADEAHAVPLFGGRRAISIRLSGNTSIIPAIELILASPPVDSWVVVGAGDLRKTSPIRRLAETHKAAAAIACYSDGARDLDRVIDEELQVARLKIAPDARTTLRDLIGGDRMASRSEVRKLCLYAADAGEISIEDVRAVIGDASAFAVDEAVDAIALGDSEATARAYRRLLAAGTPGFVVLGAAIRHFDFLHRARAAYDDGEPAEAIVSRASPPVFFKRREAVTRQISLWRMGNIERAIAGLDRAMVDSRLRGAIADEVVGQALMMVSAMAASSRRAAGATA